MRCVRHTFTPGSTRKCLRYPLPCTSLEWVFPKLRISTLGVYWNGLPSPIAPRNSPTPSGYGGLANEKTAASIRAPSLPGTSTLPKALNNPKLVDAFIVSVGNTIFVRTAFITRSSKGALFATEDAPFFSRHASLKHRDQARHFVIAP